MLLRGFLVVRSSAFLPLSSESTRRVLTNLKSTKKATQQQQQQHFRPTMSPSAPTKPTWKIFWDLQCPFSRKNWQQMPAIRSRFEADYDFEIHLTSLVFHPQAFRAQCAANLVGRKKGAAAKQSFVDACFAMQDKYMNAAVGDARPSEVDAVFASIAEEAGLLDDESFSKEYFLSHLQDWEEAVKPAYAEHKVALSYGVYGTPKHVIGEKLIDGTESSWGADEWAAYLKSTLGF